MNIVTSLIFSLKYRDLNLQNFIHKIAQITQDIQEIHIIQEVQKYLTFEQILNYMI